MSRNDFSASNLEDSASFQTDEDGSEMGHLSVSVSELNQLREHVKAMRQNMTQKHKENLRGGLGSCGNSVASGVSHDTNLEEVDLCGVLKHRNSKNASTVGSTVNSSVGGGEAAGLILSEEMAEPEEQRRLFRLSIISNIMFMLAAILYICVAHGDLQWAEQIQGIPVEVLQADDDATWRDFQQQQKSGQYNNRRSLAMKVDERMGYNNMEWNDLPPDIQLALMILGHDQRTWDGLMTSSIEELPWSKLTAEERDAAEIIGYNQTEWDWLEEEEDKLVADSQQVYSSTGADDDDDNGGGGNDDQNANDDRNEDADDQVNDGDDQVNDDVRDGDDQVDDGDDQVDDGDDQVDDGDDQVDDGDDQVDDGDDQVDDGDDQVDGGDDQVDGGDDQVDDAVEAAYGNDDGAQGDDAVQGDDETEVTPGAVFDTYQGRNDDFFPMNSQTDTEMTSNPTATPTTNPTATPTASPTTTPATPDPQFTVDGTPVTAAPQQPIPEPLTANDHPVPNLDNAQSPADLMVWGSYGWEELPEEIKKAFEILGYNEELWDTGGTAMTEDLYWNDLTPAQQEQAAILGYNQALWDEAQSADFDITANAATENEGDDYQPTDSSTIEPTDSSTNGDDDSGDGEDDEVNDDEVMMKVGDFDVDSNAVTLFFAAFFMMAVGVLNWLRERQVFHIWMVQGGVFGILSALCMDFSDFASLLLQTVSVHCFLLEAVFLLKLRKTIRPLEGLETLSYALWGADIFYAAGAIIQVVLVYWLHGNSDATYDIGLAYGEVFAAWFWFFTAAIYTLNTMALANKRIQEDATTRTLTIERRHKNGDRYTIRPAAIQLRARHSVVLT